MAQHPIGIQKRNVLTRKKGPENMAQENMAQENMAQENMAQENNVKKAKVLKQLKKVLP